MKNQTYRMTMLFDFYGELLTERQKEFFLLYYDEDLSLAEIAENYGITRQGVRDNIVRAETFLQVVEEKTGLIKRYYNTQDATDSMQKTMESIRSLNAIKLHDPDLEALLVELDTAVAVLRKD